MAWRDPAGRSDGHRDRAVRDARLDPLYVLGALLRGCRTLGRAAALIVQQQRVASLVGDDWVSRSRLRARLVRLRFGLRDDDGLPGRPGSRERLPRAGAG